jgi:phage terminase large subunit-like protein
VIEPGAKIVLGFDGSSRRDATAIVAATLDGFVAPVTVWERPEGAPAGWRVSRAEVTDVIERMMAGYDVLELACDPAGWNAELEQWAGVFGERVVEFPTNQRQRMAPACARFRSDVLEGALRHDGSEVLSRHVGHCVAKETPLGTVITKDHPDSPRKIDCAVAAVIAYERAMWHAANPPKRAVPLVAWI